MLLTDHLVSNNACKGFDANASGIEWRTGGETRHYATAARVRAQHALCQRIGAARERVFTAVSHDAIEKYATDSLLPIEHAAMAVGSWR